MACGDSLVVLEANFQIICGVKAADFLGLTILLQAAGGGGGW